MIAQFSDATETVITGIFYSEQPADVVPFQGEVTTADPRYKAWYDALPPGMLGTEPPTE